MEIIESEMHTLARVSHAIALLAEVIPYSADPNLPRVIAISCLENWFTNYRGLIEFLLLKPPKNCASAVQFVPDWSPAQDAGTDRLRRDYGMASENVSHFGSPTPSEDGEIAPPGLRTKLLLLLAVAEEFADALLRVDHFYANFVVVAVKQARAEIARQVEG